jgi:hypothetical protein
MDCPRALRDALGQRRERGIGAQLIAEQGGERPPIERLERQSPVAGLVQPGGAVLGPETRDQQGGRGRQRLDERLDERLARRVDPAQLLDHDHARAAAGAAEQQPERGEQPPAGTAQAGGETVARDSEQPEDERQVALERRVEQKRPARHLVAHGPPPCPSR